jgi:hypothetical protein
MKTELIDAKFSTDDSVTAVTWQAKFNGGRARVDARHRVKLSIERDFFSTFHICLGRRVKPLSDRKTRLNSTGSWVEMSCKPVLRCERSYNSTQLVYDWIGRFSVQLANSEHVQNQLRWDELSLAMWTQLKTQLNWPQLIVIEFHCLDQ